MFFSFSLAKNEENEAKNRAYALYATKNYNEAYEIFNDLSSSEKTAEIFLLMSNIELENNNDNLINNSGEESKEEKNENQGFWWEE